MPIHDPVPDLMQLGYTPREAAFLYLAGTSSGFFLARQYARFVQRRPGALIQTWKFGVQPTFWNLELLVV